MLWVSVNAFGDGIILCWYYEMAMRGRHARASLRLSLQAVSVGMGCPEEAEGFCWQTLKKRAVPPPVVIWHHRTWEWGVVEKVIHGVQSLQQARNVWMRGSCMHLPALDCINQAGSEEYLWELGFALEVTSSLAKINTSVIPCPCFHCL